MTNWTIYGKNGVAKATVKELELHDEWMAECFLTVTVKSAEPVSFAVGDYLDYRDERYTINYDPSVVKKARRDTYGEGFVYDNIKFVSVQDEIVRCDFNDLVLSDNKMHYTSLPTFPFYCETVDDLLDRIQANLEELYPGEWTVISPMLDRDRQRGLCVGREAAFINAYNEYIGGGSFSYDKTGVSITVDNINCWEAMKYVNDSFGLNFIVRGRVVIVGTVGLLTSKTFRYGKGNGLYELERISDSEQRIITRLRGYGAETNLPTRFYATLNQLPFAVVDSVRDRDIEGDKPFIDFNIDLTGSAYWTYQAYLKLGEWTNEQQAKSLGYLVTMRCGGYDVIGRVFTGYGLVRIYMEYSDTDDRTDAGVPVSVSDKATAIGFINAIHSGVHVYFLDRIKLGAFDKEHLEGGSVLPDNMAVNRLMLPGFPTKSLAQWVEEHDEDERIQAMIEEGFTFSTDPLRPYIDSPNKEYIGLRPGSLYFDGSNENEDIHPTIEGMEWGGERCDVILDAEKIQDNGVLADDAKEEDRQVKVILPYGGFELDELKTDETTIEIKDGMCGARSLKVKSVSKTDEGKWECICERDYDDTLHLYFPYSDFQIIRSASEPVHYVLTGIELPNSYVEAASEKLFYACVDALKQNHSPRFTFQPRIDELWMARQHDEATAAHQRSLHDTLKAGDIFVFTDEDLGIEGRVIIDVLSIKENGNNGIPTYEVTLRDEKVVSSIDKRLDKIASAVNSGLGGSGDGGGYSGRQTSSLIENLGSDLFLSKVYDDEAQGVIGFLKGAWFGAKKWMIDALGNANLNDITFSGILRGGQAVINKIKSSNYSGDGMLDTGWQIINDYEGTNSKAVFDYLYIRKKAIFEELEIRKMTYIGGNFVFSPASGRIWRVEAYKNYQIKYDSQGEQYIEVSKDDLLGYSEVTVPYMLGGRILSLFRKLVGRTGGLILGKKKLIARKFTPEEIANMKMVRCYLFSDDGSTETMNWWKVGAQARCQTFNIDSQVKWDGERHTNVGTDVANTYWWRLVSGTGRGLCDDGETHEYVDFLIKTGSTQGDKSVADAGSDVPMVGDQMVQMGHRTNPQYANVIIMETVGGDAPAFKEYKGIMGWDLTGKQKTKISPTTGTVMYSTAFHIETEYGDVLIPKDRGKWIDITPDANGNRRCYYYDRVEHIGSLWLCIMPDGTHKEDANKTHWYTQEEIDRMSEEEKQKLITVQDYTTIEPGDSTPAQQAVWQRQVSKGDKGEASFKSTVFCRATTKPNNPSASTDGGYNTYSNPLPPKVSGQPTWYDGIPSGTDTIWMSTRIFSTDGQAPQQAAWTDVQLMSDTESFDVEFSPLKSVTSADYPTDANRSQGRYSGDPDNIDTTTYKWFDPAKDNGKVNFEKMYWMATRTKENGIWGAWQVTKIKGEQGGFKSRAFCRTNEDISGVTPTGGTYTNPLPGNATTHKQTYIIGGKSVEITWYDGIPSGDEMLWSTVCTFYTEGGNDTWSKPARETDTSTQDIEFSPSTTKPNPPSGNTPFSDHTSEGWYDPSNLPSGKTMIWRAERQVRNGAYSGDWVITRIYGEKGDPGTNATTTYLRYMGPFAADASQVPTRDNWNVQGYSWTESIPVQTEAQPNVYVGVWEYEASKGLPDFTTVQPKSVSIFAHYGKTGATGRGITNVNTYFKAGTTATKPSGAPASSGWADDGNTLITKANADAGYHLFESTCTSYTDSTYSWTTPIDDGAIADMASTSEEFALADSGTTAPTSGWSASVTPTAGKWIWSRTKLTFKTGDPKYVNTQCVGYCGTNGESALTADLSNEMDMVAMTYDGKVTVQNMLTTTFSMFYGTAKQNLTNLTYRGNPSGVTVEANKATGVVTITIAKDTTLTNDSCVIKIIGTSAKGEITKDFAIQGARAGVNAVRIDLDNEADMVSVNSEGKVRFDRNVVVKARIYNGSALVTSGVAKASSLTTANMKIGDCTPTISDVASGVVTITWAFKKNNAASAIQKTIELVYDSKTYSAVFSLGTNNSDVIYQLAPSPSEVSFSLDSSDNTLKPTSISLACGYVKFTGSGSSTTASPSVSKIDDNNYLYYRTKSNDSWGAWTAYSASISVPNNTSVQDYEFCISSASAKANVADSNIIDRETVPVVKDGTSASIYRLLPSASEVQLLKTGAYSPTEVTCQVQRTIGNKNETLSSLPSGIKLYYKKDNGSESEYSAAISTNNMTKGIEFTLKNGSTVLDRENVPLVFDGVDGTDGKSIIPVPSSLVITQQKVDGGTLPLSNIHEKITIVARDGSEVVVATIGNTITKVNCEASIVTGTNGTKQAQIEITGIHKVKVDATTGAYKTDQDGKFIPYTDADPSNPKPEKEKDGNWYWKYAPSGSVSFHVTAGSGSNTFEADLTVPFGCDLIGTYCLIMEEDVKKEIYSDIDADNAHGILTLTNFNREVINSASQESDIMQKIVQQLGAGNVDPTTGSYTFTNERMRTAENSINTIKADYYYKDSQGNEKTQLSLTNTNVSTAQSNINTIRADYYESDGTTPKLSSYSTIANTTSQIQAMVTTMSGQDQTDIAMSSSGSWEQGEIHGGSYYVGKTYAELKGNSDYYIRTKTLLTVSGSITLRITAGYKVSVYMFGSDQKYLRRVQDNTGIATVNFATDVSYAALEMYKTSGTNITPSDVDGALTVGDLEACGIDIEQKIITMNADNMKFKMTSGNSAQLDFDFVNSSYKIGAFTVTNESLGTTEGHNNNYTLLYHDGRIRLRRTDTTDVLTTAGDVTMNTAPVGVYSSRYSAFTISSANVTVGTTVGITTIQGSSVSVSGSTTFSNSTTFNSGMTVYGTANAGKVTTGGDVHVGYALKVLLPDGSDEDAGLRIWYDRDKIKSDGTRILRISIGNGNFNQLPTESQARLGEVYLDGTDLKVKIE